MQISENLIGLKILLINDFPKEYGGAETVFLQEKKVLREWGLNVYVFSFNEEFKKSQNEYIYKEPKNYFLKKFFKFTFNYKIYRSLRDFIKKIKPDLIHLHMHHKYPLSVLLALKNQKVIYTAHSPAWLCATGWAVTKDNFESCKCGIGLKCFRRKCVSFWLLPLYYFLSKTWKSLLKKNISVIITPSKFLKNLFELNGINEKVIYIPNFVDEKKFHYAEYPENSKNVLYMGMLVPHKGVYYIIKAFSLILKSHPDARLIILGDGPEKDKLQKLCRSLKVKEKVKFCGRIPTQFVKKFISQSNVVVVPSLWNENSPMVVYESMSVGRPIVGFKRGGIPELVGNGERGYIVNPGDIEELAERISYLLRNPSVAESLGKNARKFVEEKLSLKCFAKNFFYLCLSLL